MKLCDKILTLRKQHGLSQEMLAEKLNVSRQAISRWESGTSLPDASNILQLSELFGVTTDYLLHDEYENDNDVPVVQQTKRTEKTQANCQLAFVICTGLNIMLLIYQIIMFFELQSPSLSLLGTLLSVAVAVGFECVYRKLTPKSEITATYYRKFYIIAFWLAAYFPIHLCATFVMMLYPRSYSSLVFESAVLLVYILFALLETKFIKKIKI